MKKLNYIIIFILLLSSCSNWDKKKPLYELYSQEFLQLKTKSNFRIINLDSIKNFSELKTKMGEITCEGKVSGLRFKLNDTIYNLTGFSDCPSTGGIGCYFRRNVLTISNDSLMTRYCNKNSLKPINYLKSELNNIMAKTYNFQYNENKVKPALIYFHVEDKYPISTTKKVLKEITKQFSTINSKSSPEYFKYNILFESFDITKIPPPPPPTKSNKLNN